MLTRKPSLQREDRDWFHFSAGLMHSLCSDYIAVRILYRVEPLTTAFTIVPKMLDVVEKSLKLHLAVQTHTATALSDARSEYGHNVEKLRSACAHYHPVFDDEDIRAFTKDLNDKDGKLYQHLRYGAQETTAGFETNLATLLPVVDKIFSKAILLLPEGARRGLVFTSSLKNLISRSRFDQSQFPAQLLEILRVENAHFAELSDYCHRLDEEHAALAAQIQTATTQPIDA